VVAFQPNGELEQSFGTSGETRFTSPMAESVWILPGENGEIVMAALQPLIQSKPQAQAYLNLFRFSADGTIGTAFGEAGTAQIQLPYSIQALLGSSGPITLAGNGQVNDIVSTATTSPVFNLTQILGNS
jgi:hypothetical protein